VQLYPTHNTIAHCYLRDLWSGVRVTFEDYRVPHISAPINRGNRVASSQCDEPIALRETERVAGNKKRTYPTSRNRRESSVDVAVLGDVVDLNLLSDGR
jgi:hypothetical protein